MKKETEKSTVKCPSCGAVMKYGSHGQKNQMEIKCFGCGFKGSIKTEADKSEH